MTNEEAIKILTLTKRLEDTLGNFDGGVKNSDLSKSLAMAIKALGHQPCDDCISRQQAIEALDEIRHALWEIDIPSPTVPEYVEPHEQVQSVWKLLDKKQKELYALPSAQPEIIRCRECKYAEVADKEDTQDGYICQFHRGSIWFSGSYCSWAERRTDE